MPEGAVIGQPDELGGRWPLELVKLSHTVTTIEYQNIPTTRTRAGTTNR